MMSASESSPTLLSWLVFNPERNGQHGTARRMWSRYTQAIVAKVRELGPYAAIELILPGGSLIAVLLWLYRRQKKASLFTTVPCRIGRGSFVLESDQSQGE
jgi:hypothetical protein